MNIKSKIHNLKGKTEKVSVFSVRRSDLYLIPEDDKAVSVIPTKNTNLESILRILNMDKEFTKSVYLYNRNIKGISVITT